MSPAGRRKAADIKRRIIQACEKAGLTVQGAKYYHRREHADRLVQVAAVSPGCCGGSVIDICTTVGLNGDFSGCVGISCLVSEDRAGENPFSQPVFIMQGREFTPLRGLAGELRKTVEEREQVVAAIRMGVEGPYRFKQTLWQMHPPGMADPDD